MTRRSATALLIALTAVTLTACAATDPLPPSRSDAPAVTEPADDTTPSMTPTPTPVADEHSQVVDGVLFQGTERAPIRIGTDVPGQPPALQAQVDPPGTNPADRIIGTLAEEQDKYLVYIAPTWSDGVGGTNGGTQTGWMWKLFGLDRFGSFRELSHAGLASTRGETISSEPYLSEQAALDAPKMLDGRVLDRAEYVILVEDWVAVDEW